MTVVRTIGAKGPPRRAANFISEALAPIVVIPLLTVGVSLASADSLVAGAGYAAIAVLFAAALPYAVLLVGVRSGRFADRHVRARAQRPALLAFTLASVSVALALLWVLQAPGALFALMAAMVAGMTVTLLVTTFWKISIHTSCVAGAVTSLAVLVHPGYLVLAPLVVMTGWARVVRRDHSFAQVVAGTAVGAAIAWGVLVWLSRAA
jgi:hypothetical protein